MKGRKRHALVDAQGRLLMVQVGPASVQDRDGGVPLLQASRALFAIIERVFADSAYAAERVAAATRIIVEIVRKAPDQVGFAAVSGSTRHHAAVDRFRPCKRDAARSRAMTQISGRVVATDTRDQQSDTNSG